jgi:RNase adaptor protein for sRNA GlmZ degradation
MTVTITSFGYLHGQPPPAHLTIDLRTHFRDPHIDPALREMTARDEAVRDAVLATPGIGVLLDATTAAVLGFLAGPGTGPVYVASGCAGGRHRGAAFASELANRLRANGITADLTHRDIDKPVVHR